MAKTQQQPDQPAPLMECNLSFSFDDPATGAATTVAKGMKLRADHPWVAVGGDFWVPADSPHDERKSLTDYIQVDGTQTVPGKRRPDGYRRDWHGPLKG